MTRRVNVRKHLRWTPTGKRAKVRRHGRNIRVPPNWKNVKFFDSGPNLATGIDKKGRTQYIQNPRFIKSQSKVKFKRIEKLQKKKKEVLNRVIKDVNKDNTEAEVVYTMFQTGFRPGSEKDTKADKPAFGTTTLLKKHVKVKPNNKVEFDFVGKKGVQVHKEIQDKKLASIIKDNLANPKVFDTNINKVRDYFDKKTDGDFQLKDIRTLKAYDVADNELKKLKGKGLEPKEVKKIVIKKVSEELDNTEAVAAKSYIEPKLPEVK